MSNAPKHPISKKLLDKLQLAAGESGQLNYKEFIQIALYDRESGYYRRAAQRVGRSEANDFYTSQSLGPVFGALVTDAIRKIIQAQTDSPLNLGDWTLVEVGYESESNWWNAGECPFENVIRIGVGDPMDFTGRCVVFSNELFDAQPFHRVAFLDNAWHELGVDVSNEQSQEIILTQLSPEVAGFLPRLPHDAEDGYLVDLPLATKPLLNQITALPWSGLFVALDYGKSWSELIHDFPRGTARAYFKHQQSPHLTAQPGMQDLTCHICWDWLADGLRESGFQNITRESQEAFFIKQASNCIEQIVTANIGKFDPFRQSLMHLIHPATMGQQFQALWGFRPE